MIPLNSPKVERAVRACRQVCVGSSTPLTNYWMIIDLLRERCDWTESEVDDFRNDFLESLIDDFEDAKELRKSSDCFIACDAPTKEKS